MKKQGKRRTTAGFPRLLRLSLFLSLTALSLPFLLASCGKEEPSSFEGGSYLLTPDDMQGFTVVRSDSASDIVVKEALRICKEISDATGEKVDLVTDWNREAQQGTDGSGEAEGPLELLVGLTAREESEALTDELLGGDYYLLRTSGRKLLIAATSEALLSDAVDKFLLDYVSVRGDEVRIARKIDYRSENYPFFPIVRGGESQCGFVLPQTAGGALSTAVNYIAGRLGEEYGCSFPVYSETELDSLSGMIVVGRVSSTLSEQLLSTLEKNSGIVKYAGEQLLITGTTDEAVIAAVSEFYAELQSNPDTDFTGRPYAHYHTGTVLSCTWQHADVPYLVGGRKLEEESIASAETQVSFGGVSEALLLRYTETLQSEGFSIIWESVGGSKSFVAENAHYRLQVNYTPSTAISTVYILKKH